MGVMPRKSGEKFIITSDRVAGELPSNRVPKKTPLEVFQVWNGQGWSATSYKSEGMVDGQAKDDESGQVQAEPPSLVSGGLLRMISPVSDTFK